MALFYIFGLLFAAFYLITKVVQRYRKAWDIIRDCGFPVVPSQHWLFGSLDIMKSYSTHWQLGKLTRKYGRTYGIMQGSHPTVVTSDPKIIYEICFKQFRLFHSRIVSCIYCTAFLCQVIH